jgi:hypothetical protein
MTELPFTCEDDGWHVRPPTTDEEVNDLRFWAFAARGLLAEIDRTLAAWDGPGVLRLEERR